jgi:hypothetical protein
VRVDSRGLTMSRREHGMLNAALAARRHGPALALASWQPVECVKHGVSWKTYSRRMNPLQQVAGTTVTGDTGTGIERSRVASATY